MRLVVERDVLHQPGWRRDENEVFGGDNALTWNAPVVGERAPAATRARKS
jgi:hypothetical protein